MLTHGLDYFISIVILSNLDPHAEFRRNFSNFPCNPFLMSNIKVYLTNKNWKTKTKITSTHLPLAWRVLVFVND